MLKKKNLKKQIIVFGVVIAAFAILQFFYPLRSILVMSVYSRINYSDSVMKENEFDIDIKGGCSTSEKDWYPFVNVYDTSWEFSRYTGEDLSLTVMYNFGAFNWNSSSFYDDESEYFAAFYGAYVIHDNAEPEREYGFSEDGIDIDEIAAVPMFDYKYLVIEDLGCENPVFEILEYEAAENVEYAGYDGWTEIDAVMRSNSPSHAREEFKLGYIQYGLPLTNDKKDFFEVELYGKMYARYFEQYQCTIVLYVMGADEGMIESCDENILCKTQISDNK